MPELLRMPQLAADATGAVLLSWSIAEHAEYSRADTIATVETAKAVVDIEAVADGVLFKTLVPEGADIDVGTPIALIGAPGESLGELGAVLAELGVAGSGTGARVVIDTAPTAGPHDATTPVAALPETERTRTFASPLARRLAREAGLSVDDLAGTGPNGRIIRRDVEAAVSRRAPAGSAAPSSAPAAPVAGSGYSDVPHSRSRRAVAARLTESVRTAPHFYLRGTARVDRLLKLRAQLNKGGSVRISVNDLVVKAVACAHLQVPAMNVIWLPEATRQFSTVDLSVAVATERGLVTPVVRSVEQLSVSALARAVRDFVERAHAGRLQQHELEGGSATVTNLGMFGTEAFAAIINPPQAAILAVGVARQEPIVRRGSLTVGTVLHVTLSVDHRPVDGATAARWMAALLSLLENPARILA